MKLKLSLLLGCWLSLVAIQGVQAEPVATVMNTVAMPSTALIAVNQQLLANVQHNKLAEAALLQLQNFNIDQLQTITDYPTAIDKVKIRMDFTNAEQESLQTELSNIEEAILNTRTRINALQQQIQPLMVGEIDEANTERLKNLKSDLHTQKELLSLQNKIQLLIKKTQTIYDEHAVYLDKLNKLLISSYRNYKIKTRREHLLAYQAQLETRQQTWLEKVNQLNAILQKQGLDLFDANGQTFALEQQRFIAQEHANFVALEINYAGVIYHLNALIDLPREDLTLSQLNDNLDQNNDERATLLRLQDLCHARLSVINDMFLQETKANPATINSLPDYSAELTELKNLYTTQEIQINKAINRTNNYEVVLRHQLQSVIAQRQGLPGFELAGWGKLLHEISSLPLVASEAAWTSILNVKRAAFMSHWSQRVILASVILSLLVLWYLASKRLRQLCLYFRAKDQTLAGNLSYISFELFRRNLYFIIGFALVLAVLITFAIPIVNFMVILSLWATILTTKVIIDGLRICFLENQVTHFGHDVKLYHSLKWGLLIGGVFSYLTILSHLVHVDYAVSDIFNRLMMLFLLAIAVVLLTSWRVIPTLLHPYLSRKPRYIEKTIDLIAVLIPLTLVSNALIGLYGYIDLAWTMAKYELIFLSILTAYLLVRGLLIEAIDHFSKLLIRQLRNGWLWSEVVLKPLDRLARLMLLLFACYCLLVAYGWRDDPLIQQRFLQWLHMPLIKIGNNNISCMSFILFLALVLVLYWAARWTKEFAYRWLFASTKDHGIRNSFSTFTQYTFVITGFLIILKVLGIDLSGLAVVAGGLAVGLGFGLRDLANNLLCGVLLLIERPIKTGDFVSIGTYEGEVARLGMRSITVNTWDRMDVLVPNSEIYSKSFVNWTHQDTIIRTVVTIKIDRIDDPHQIQAIINDALAAVPEVLTKPVPEVFFKEISDLLIEFEVRYHINVKYNSRAQIRSAVLFKIWDAFKANGIKPPLPQYRILCDAGEDELKQIYPNLQQ